MEDLFTVTSEERNFRLNQKTYKLIDKKCVLKKLLLHSRSLTKDAHFNYRIRSFQMLAEESARGSWFKNSKRIIIDLIHEPKTLRGKKTSRATLHNEVIFSCEGFFLKLETLFEIPHSLHHRSPLHGPSHAWTRVYMFCVHQIATYLHNKARDLFSTFFVFYFYYSNTRWKLMLWKPEADRVTARGMSTNVNSSRTSFTFWLCFFCPAKQLKLCQLSSCLAVELLIRTRIVLIDSLRRLMSLCASIIALLTLARLFATLTLKNKVLIKRNFQRN